MTGTGKDVPVTNH